MRIDELIIVDNFLDRKDFDQLCRLKFDDVRNGTKVYHNEIDKNDKIKISCLDKDLITRLHKNYHKKATDILRKLCPQKLDLYEYSDFTIIITHKNFEYPFHDDTPNKILSGVIYLSPEKNAGTMFSLGTNKENSIKHSVEWKPNRAVFFSRKEKETWHSYKGDGISNRIALVYNLNTSKIRDVYKIEKKSYFLGLLRYKINPYLYRYFKFTI